VNIIYYFYFYYVAFNGCLCLSLFIMNSWNIFLKFLQCTEFQLFISFGINESSVCVFALCGCPSWHVQGHLCLFVCFFYVTIIVNHTFLSSNNQLKYLPPSLWGCWMMHQKHLIDVEYFYKNIILCWYQLTSLIQMLVLAHRNSICLCSFLFSCSN
jgi:hypothetical protein